MKLCKRWTVVLVVLMTLTIPAHGLERRNGARPLGMGDAFVALADDINTLNYNPAGLAIEKNMEIIAEYANLYPGLDDGSIQENYIGYAQNLYNNGGIGLIWNNRSVTGAYTENEMMLGYALQPAQDLPLYFGLTAKAFYIAYTDSTSRENNDFFDNGFEKWQWGLDVGVLGEVMKETKVFPGLRAGLSLINLNQPDIGLQSTAVQPLEIRVGTSAVYGEWDGGLDLSLKDGELQVHLGAEKWFQNREWGVRAGMIAGSGTNSTYTLGGSYTLDLELVRLRFDYSFNYSFGGIQETFGIQRLSINLINPLPTLEELKKMEIERRKQAKLERKRLRSQAYRLIEETRAMVIKFETRATLPQFKEKVGEFRENAQSAYALVTREEFKASINAMERIQRDIEALMEKMKMAMKDKQRKQAKRAEIVQKVKKYLMRKILQYGSTRQKAKQLRQQAGEKYEKDIYRVEQMIFEARNALVKRRDLRGFLSKLDQATKALSQVETKIRNEALAGF